MTAILDNMARDRDYVVLDVETSGTDPHTDRILSIAALIVSPAGTVQHALHTLLDPGVDPGPTHVHGLTTAMLAGHPRYPDIAPTLARLLRDRILVAHNAAFDYAFLAAEAHRSHTALPVATVLCTVELTKLLDLDLDSLSLAALARHWNIPQAHPHDALDDARVLTTVLGHALTRARRLDVRPPLRTPETLTPPTFTAHRAA